MVLPVVSVVRFSLCERKTNNNRRSGAHGRKNCYVFEELAENLLALNQLDAAQTYFALARAVMSDE